MSKEMRQHIDNFRNFLTENSKKKLNISDVSESKKFKDIEIGDKFLRFGENGQLWKKISDKHSEFIKDVGEKRAPYGKERGSINVFPQTMDVTIYKK
jgi:hypothetical protein